MGANATFSSSIRDAHSRSELQPTFRHLHLADVTTSLNTTCRMYAGSESRTAAFVPIIIGYEIGLKIGSHDHGAAETAVAPSEGASL